MNELIEAKLKQIIYPGLNKDIVSLGMVKDLKIDNKKVVILLDIRAEDKNIFEKLKQSITLDLSSIPQVDSVEVNLSTEKIKGEKDSVPSKDEEYLSEVKYKVAIASGKGGVGKSTISVNIAVALSKLGMRVGLLDADIYGPSIPLMLGVTEKPRFINNQIMPIKKYGIKLMSLGFLIEDNSPVIWRGPLVMRAIQQLMSDVNWRGIDIMLFDMPPGTGDAQLTLSQSIALDGSVIVTTPQDVALLDAVKGVQMFQKVNVPILGIVENMSYFICEHCHQKTEIFAAGGAKRECKKLGVDLLGEIPLVVDLRVACDEGIPIVEKDPESPLSKEFMNIASMIIKKIK